MKKKLLKTLIKEVKALKEVLDSINVNTALTHSACRGTKNNTQHIYDITHHISDSVVKLNDNLCKALLPIAARYEYLNEIEPNVTIKKYETDASYHYSITRNNQEELNASTKENIINSIIEEPITEESPISDASSDYSTHISSEEAGPIETT